METREAKLGEGEHQRELAGRLVLAALRERDAANDAAEQTRVARFLSATSRDLSMSPSEDATRAIMQRCALPRRHSWCIVDIIEHDGAVHRLPAIHPDPACQELARTLADVWHPDANDALGAARLFHAVDTAPVAVAHDSPALLAAAQGARSLGILRQLGFGSLLVVPLVARARVLGAMTFVSRHGDTPFTDDEIATAEDVASRCAMALENARLYREADALRIAAETANSAKSAFLGTVSHELRTPLNAIGGYADLLAMGIRGPVTPGQEAALERIKVNQQRLLKLIAEILDYAHGSRTEIRSMGPVRIRLALDDAAEAVAVAVHARGLTLDHAACDPEAVVMADPDRLRQILANLLTNAVKYTPEGGCAIVLACRIQRDVVNITVADCGLGIAQSDIELVFEPFTQLANGLTNRAGGVGLGLSISRDLARAMRGDLTVTSVLGVGSVFTLTLPLAAHSAFD